MTGFLGVHSDPAHIVAYTDGEIRQQFEAAYIGKPVGGEPTVNDEAGGSEWAHPRDMERYDIHPSMRRQISDYLTGGYP